MVNETNYRKNAVKIMKIAGQEIIDRAEELIAHAVRVKNIEITIKIPSLSDKLYDIPRIEVRTEVYPQSLTIENIYKVIKETEAENDDQ